MSNREKKQLAKRLHDRGLRKKVAKRAAAILTQPRLSREPPPEVKVLAHDLRALADDLEHVTIGVVAEHAQPQAAAREAARHPPGNGGKPPGWDRVRPRARRS
jgi:hypothetical protein